MSRLLDVLYLERWGSVPALVDERYPPLKPVRRPLAKGIAMPGREAIWCKVEQRWVKHCPHPQCQK